MAQHDEGHGVAERESRLPDVGQDVGDVRGRGQLDLRPIDIAERRAQARLGQTGRNGQLHHAGTDVGEGPQTAAQHERHGDKRPDQRSPLQHRRGDYQEQACPGVGAEQLGNEREVRSERRRQQADEEVRAVVIADERACMPGQLRWESARADCGRQSEMDWRVGNHHQLTAGERRPHEREDHHGEARGHARPGPNGARRAPRQDRAQGQRDAPTDEEPRRGREPRT